MRRAGFRYVFLGIENVLEDDLKFLRAAAKNTARDQGVSAGNATLQAINYLHKNKMAVVGGLIVAIRTTPPSPSRRIWTSPGVTWIGLTFSIQPHIHVLP
jgi:hypothetical protein